MFDSKIRFPGVHPESAATKPTTSVAWIKPQSAIDQCYHGLDILAEFRQYISGVRENDWIVARHFERPSCQISSLSTRHFQVCRPAIQIESEVTACGEGQGRSITGIEFEPSFKQFERQTHTLP